MPLRSFFARLFGSAETDTTGPVRVEDGILASMPDRIVIGLGNPGPEYAGTRHNAGFLVVESMALRQRVEWIEVPSLEARVARAEIGGLDFLFVEPLTFMNRSGRTAAAIQDRWPAFDFSAHAVVVFDDLDLPLGRVRLRVEGGGGGQRGMTDILEALDTRAVPRLRVGIGRPEAGGQAVIDWVLGAFDAADETLAEEAIARAGMAIETAFRDGFPDAMGRFNGKK